MAAYIYSKNFLCADKFFLHYALGARLRIENIIIMDGWRFNDKCSIIWWGKPFRESPGSRRTVAQDTSFTTATTWTRHTTQHFSTFFFYSDSVTMNTMHWSSCLISLTISPPPGAECCTFMRVKASMTWVFLAGSSPSALFWSSSSSASACGRESNPLERCKTPAKISNDSICFWSFCLCWI